MTVNAMIMMIAGLSCFNIGDDPLSEAEGRDDHVDSLDADEGNNDAAETIDQKVAAKQRACADSPVFDALSDSGIRATMISALKMIADRMALCGVQAP